MKPIKGYENYYQIDESGNIFSTRMQRYLKLTDSMSSKRRGVECVRIALTKNGIRKTHKIHRLIAEHFIPNPENLLIVDHINGDVRDNRISNLRWVTSTQNNWNRRKSNNKTSKYKGVTRHGKHWSVGATNEGKHIYIGSYKNEIEAAKAYNEYAKETHGEFAVLNVI